MPKFFHDFLNYQRYHCSGNLRIGRLQNCMGAFSKMYGRMWIKQRNLYICTTTKSTLLQRIRGKRLINSLLYMRLEVSVKKNYSAKNCGLTTTEKVCSSASHESIQRRETQKIDSYSPFLLTELLQCLYILSVFISVKEMIIFSVCYNYVEIVNMKTSVRCQCRNYSEVVKTFILCKQTRNISLIY